jgi:hypothetical protein
MAEKKFLEKDQLQYLLERLVEIIDQKTQINIITDIDNNSTNMQIPGAKAVYDLVVSAIAGTNHLTKKVVPILPAAGDENVLYLIPVDADTYRQWIYVDSQWFDFGTTDVNLSDYWAKDELKALTNDEVQEIIDDVMGA